MSVITILDLAGDGIWNHQMLNGYNKAAISPVIRLSVAPVDVCIRYERIQRGALFLFPR
jgi:hypothetical protein